MACLQPAERLSDSTYDLKPLRAPVLNGLPLRIFVSLLDTPLGSLIMPRLLRNAGLPQVMQEVDIPENPTFLPTWPAQAKSDTSKLVILNHGTVCEKANAAADVITGSARTAPAASEAETRRWTVADFQAAFMHGLVTPSQVAENVVKAMAASEGHDPPLRLFASYDLAHIREQAAESTIRYQQMKPRSILEGIPFAVKDLTDALPYQTTMGCAYMAERRPVTEDAPLVAALKAAGAVLIGKAATVEFGVNPLGLNAKQGTPRNPHDTARLTGGSSSGSAGIVAAGICPFAIAGTLRTTTPLGNQGSDGGGSIRVPASFCGVTGMMPTQGHKSARGSHSASSTSSPGPIAASIADVALVHAVTANAGAEGKLPAPPPASLPLSLAAPGTAARLDGLRIGIFDAWFADAEPDVVLACRQAVGILQAQGAKVVSISVPELDMARLAHSATITSEFAQEQKAHLRIPGLRSRLNNDTRLIIKIGEYQSATDFLQAQRIRRRQMIHLARVFQDCDIIATPTTPITAPPVPPSANVHGESNVPLVGTVMRFATPANFAGLPALSIPVGHDVKGLPIGLQLMGAAWTEARLLMAGSVIEAALHDRTQLPAIRYDVLFGSNL